MSTYVLFIAYESAKFFSDSLHKIAKTHDHVNVCFNRKTLHVIERRCDNPFNIPVVEKIDAIVIAFDVNTIDIDRKLVIDEIHNGYPNITVYLHLSDTTSCYFQLWKSIVNDLSGLTNISRHPIDINYPPKIIGIVATIYVILSLVRLMID